MMKVLTNKKWMLTLALAAVVSCFTACSSDSVLDVTTPNTGEMVGSGTSLSLTVNTKGISGATRATDITTSPDEKSENTINRITVGIFAPGKVDTNGKIDPKTELVRNIYVLEKNINGEEKEGTFTMNEDGSKANININASFLHQGDKILVAVNAPKDKFASCYSADAFNSAVLDAGSALTTNVTTGAQSEGETYNNIPMYGEATLQAPTDNKFSLDVPVKHLLAKISLESLKVDFSTDANDVFNDAKFTPTSIFLINVPRKLRFNSNGWDTDNEAYFQGWGELDGDNYTLYRLACLRTSDITAQELSSTNKEFNGKYYFYTLPNQFTTSETEEHITDESGHRTKLVIAGYFQKGTQGGKTKVYYPISLNAVFQKGGIVKAAEDNTEAFKVYPNRNYKLNVTIKTRGLDNPYEDSDSKQLSVTVTPDKFNEVTQNTTFE